MKRRTLFGAILIVSTLVLGFTLPFIFYILDVGLLGGLIQVLPAEGLLTSLAGYVIAFTAFIGPALLSGFFPVLFLWHWRGISRKWAFFLGAIGPALFAALVFGIFISHFGITDVLSDRENEGPNPITAPPDIPFLAALWIILVVLYSLAGGLGGYAASRIIEINSKKNLPEVHGI